MPIQESGFCLSKRKHPVALVSRGHETNEAYNFSEAIHLVLVRARAVRMLPHSLETEAE